MEVALQGADHRASASSDWHLVLYDLPPIATTTSSHWLTELRNQNGAEVWHNTSTNEVAAFSHSTTPQRALLLGPEPSPQAYPMLPAPHGAHLPLDLVPSRPYSPLYDPTRLQIQLHHSAQARNYFQLLAAPNASSAATSSTNQSTGHTPPSPNSQGRNHSGPGLDWAAFLNEGYYRRFFIEESKLGVGGWGHVYKVRHVISAVDLGEFALKKVPIGEAANTKWFFQVIKEVKMLEQLKSHPNIISYRHSWLERDRVADFGPEIICAFILMDYANGGNLYDFVRNRHRRGKVLSAEEISNFFVDILVGIDHLHSLKACHRDIKPQNLLLNYEDLSANGIAAPDSLPTVMLSDFGTSVSVASGPLQRTGATGTMEWIPPELLSENLPETYTFDFRSDMWPIGLILYFMLHGCLPWRNVDPISGDVIDTDRLTQEILHFSQVPLKASRYPEFDEVVRRLLRPTPSTRPNARELLQSFPWIQRALAQRRLKEFYPSNPSQAAGSTDNTAGQGGFYDRELVPSHGARKSRSRSLIEMSSPPSARHSALLSLPPAAEVSSPEVDLGSESSSASAIPRPLSSSDTHVPHLIGDEASSSATGRPSNSTGVRPRLSPQRQPSRSSLLALPPPGTPLHQVRSRLSSVFGQIGRSVQAPLAAGAELPSAASLLLFIMLYLGKLLIYRLSFESAQNAGGQFTASLALELFFTTSALISLLLSVQVSFSSRSRAVNQLWRLLLVRRREVEIGTLLLAVLGHLAFSSTADSLGQIAALFVFHALAVVFNSLMV